MTKKNKKILAISHYSIADNRGGGEIMLHEILKYLVSIGYKVDMIATKNEGDTINIDGVTIYRGISKSISDFKKYDLVISQFAEGDSLAPIIKKTKIPFVYVVHNTNLLTHNTVISEPDLIIFNTQWVKEFHKYNGNSIVIHPPVYSENHATEHGDMITLINLVPSKGSNMFYNMAFRLSKFQFLGVEGGYFKESQQYIRRPNIHFIKNTNDMKNDVWARTKVLLMPSIYESYGMTAIEACASGIPVVACKTPGLLESLDYAGIFPKTTMVKDWRDELFKLMTNKEYYQERSELALKRSKEINPLNELKKLDKKIKELIK